MAKEFIINTSRINSYGSRVLTAGIDTAQFEKNPVLLYMHQRGWDGQRMPIGRVENLRTDGDQLIGTPVFDVEDDFAAKISRKYESGFLRMCSAGLEPIEFSSDPEHILHGQCRATVTKSKLVEVSIVDIGSNDDSLQLYREGKLLKLATGEESDFLPLLKPETDTADTDAGAGDNKATNQNQFTMNLILLALGLAATATEADAVAAINKLQAEAKEIETIRLARITGAVDAAIAANKTTADKRDHLVTLGKTAGFDALQTTLDMLTPVRKPNEIINHAAGSGSTAAGTMAKYSEMAEAALEELRTNNRPEYIRLFKAEFGFEPKFD